LRALLGAKSFLLFTMDRLINALIKQLVVVAHNPACRKLVGLYHTAYEWSKAYPKLAKGGGEKKEEEAEKSGAAAKKEGGGKAGGGADEGEGKSAAASGDGSSNSAHKTKLRYSAQAARMYLDMCVNTVSTDEPSCVQMEYFEDTDELAIGLLDASEVAARKHAPEEWWAYQKEFLKDAAYDLKKAPFLGRNLRSSVKRFATKAGAVGEAGEGLVASSAGAESSASSVLMLLSAALRREAMRGVEQHNGLEFRMGMRDFRLQFVDDTQEYMIRRKRKRTNEEEKKRQGLFAAANGAFRSWAKEQLAALGGALGGSSAGGGDEGRGTEEAEDDGKSMEIADSAAPSKAS